MTLYLIMINSRLSLKSLAITKLAFLLFLSFLNGPILASPESENRFNSGYAHYEREEYDKAIPELESAVKLEPLNAQYHHILAKSYGREAEKVNWLKAMNFAKKTLAHLQLAVELDENNLEYLDDLMDYYREAPGFLGGNNQKADEIEKQIEMLEKSKNQAAYYPGQN